MINYATLQTNWWECNVHDHSAETVKRKKEPKSIVSTRIGIFEGTAFSSLNHRWKTGTRLGLVCPTPAYSPKCKGQESLHCRDKSKIEAYRQ